MVMSGLLSEVCFQIVEHVHGINVLTNRCITTQQDETVVSQINHAQIS
jgi:hypothetical protein